MQFIRKIISINSVNIRYGLSSLAKHKMKSKYKQFKHNIKQQNEYKQQKEKASIPQFQGTGLMNDIVQVLEQNDIKSPSSIQQLSLYQMIKKNNDYKAFYIAAQTGTGKTLSYLLPVLNNLKKQELEQKMISTLPNRPQCIIIVPSKELVEQTYQVIKLFIHRIKFKVLKMGYNFSVSHEFKELKEGVDIVVTTLERLKKQRNIQSLYFSNLRYLIFDEVDTLIDSGHNQQVVELSQQIFKLNQKVVYVGATYTGPLNQMFNQLFGTQKLQQQFLNKIIDKNTHYNLMNVNHEFLHINQLDKQTPMLELLNQLRLKKDEQLMIFCNTIPSCQSLEYKLKNNGHDCVSLHGDIKKQFRIQNYNRFQQKQIKILISTDLGSRGLDFKLLRYVINFDFPQTSSDYLHRAGRTGRAGEKGTVYSLYHNKDKYLIDELKSSYQNNRPLEIKGSSYNKINKEVLQSKQNNPDLQIADKVKSSSKGLLPPSYYEFRQKWEQQQQNKQLQNYVPLVDRNKKQLKLLGKQRNKIKKHQRTKLGKVHSQIRVHERKIRKKMFYENLQNKQKIDKQEKKYKRKVKK